MKVLKFGAVWCPGCLVMRPRWKEVENENPWLETEYYDYDVDKEMVERYQITNILPVFIFLDQSDNEFMRLDGEIEKNELINVIKQNRNR